MDQTHVDNTSGCFIVNEDIKNCITYVKYALSLLHTIKKMNLLWLPKTDCTYLLLYIETDDMLLMGTFESCAFLENKMIYIFCYKVQKEETDKY